MNMKTLRALKKNTGNPHNVIARQAKKENLSYWDLVKRDAPEFITRKTYPEGGRKNGIL